jgi:hypothetical protein
LAVITIARGTPPRSLTLAVTTRAGSRRRAKKRAYFMELLLFCNY